MTEVPERLAYSEAHVWVRTEPDGSASLGLTAIGLEQLGEVVLVSAPEVGRRLASGEVCAVVESAKAASEIPAPLSGEVVETNASLGAAPEALNRDPYAAWIFRMRPAEPAEMARLLDAPAYRRIVGA